MNESHSTLELLHRIHIQTLLKLFSLLPPSNRVAHLTYESIAPSISLYFPGFIGSTSAELDAYAFVGVS